MTNMQEMVWHNDGHKIYLKIVRSELEIVSVHCPNDEVGECLIPDYGCVVAWFTDRFGMECNVGSCSASESIQVCWTLNGSRRDLEEAQLWFMPVTDEVFNAWFVSKTN